jgi:hypothetical protein
MKLTEQTRQQLERFVRKISEKLPASDDTSLITDIHLRVSQDSGEMVALDDSDQEITRCVVEQWIENKDENFYEEVADLLRAFLKKMSQVVGNLGILKPYSIVLEDDEKEPQGELFVADDDTVIIDGDLMEGLDDDLNNFLDQLLKED